MFKIRREQKEALAGEFGTLGMITPCQYCLVVRIVEIKGLFKGGVDNRPKPIPTGTTRGASYVAGYASEDDKGRIFINHATDGTDRSGTGKWKADTQGIEIKVVVDPPSVPIPPGTMIVWSWDDPDDPINEDPMMHRDAGRILDPNDYLGRWKEGAKGEDNNAAGKGRARTGFEQIEPRYPLSADDETPVDPLTRVSKVRFNVSDTAGDNFRVKAKLRPIPPGTTTVPTQTGIMTAWNRVDIEYVKMESARDLPLDQIAAVFAPACAQLDISERREEENIFVMGETEPEARKEVDKYATKGGQFKHENEDGWFFVASANRFMPPETPDIVYEGQATTHGHYLTLPTGKAFKKKPKAVRIFNPERMDGLLKMDGALKHWRTDLDLYVFFETRDPVRSGEKTYLPIDPHDFHKVDDPDKTFFWADLNDYGFAEGTKVDIQVITAATRVDGTNAGTVVDDTKHLWFAGRVLLFTTDSPQESDLKNVCHELCHAFDNAHKCGNWDWTNRADRTSCCMNYRFFFVLDDGSPREPIPWTQNRVSAELCGPHLRHLRDYHIQDNYALEWGKH